MQNKNSQQKLWDNTLSYFPALAGTSCSNKQIKPTLRYYFLPIRLAKIKTIDNTKCGGWEATGTWVHCWWECKQMKVSGKTLGYPVKLKMCLSLPSLVYPQRIFQTMSSFLFVLITWNKVKDIRTYPKSVLPAEVKYHFMKNCYFNCMCIFILDHNVLLWHTVKRSLKTKARALTIYTRKYTK